MESLCQRSFRPLFKYRTIVLYLFSPHPCRAQLFIDLLFFFIYISGLFLSLFTSSTLHLLFFLHFIYTSFSIHFRDHPATILNVTVGFLSLLYLFLFYSACSFFVSKGNNPPFHLVSFSPKTSFKNDTTLCFFCTLPCALYFVLLSFSFYLSCTYIQLHATKNGNSD